MHFHTLKNKQHSHDFAVIHEHGEARTRQVFALTIVTMVIEIVAGIAFGSMALLADGWHMGTHSAAFAITIFAYSYARKHAGDERFSFGTGKVTVLGGFASAVALAVVALVMVVESIERMVHPLDIHFNEAIFVAILGLIVNLASAWLLSSHSDTGHTHHHGDHNLKAAYFHVLADALTSVLAIIALLTGKVFGWIWMDALMGIVGAVIIMRWAYGLLLETSSILLDGSATQSQRTAIRSIIEADADNRVSDLHVWKVSASHFAVILSLVTHNPKSPEYYKALLQDISELSHISVEVLTCEDKTCKSG
ncbi:MAG: CDF family Co(II)/Ni(II) efflux transporter DmeF [Gammaproteobacteria bacterium]|nr:CDF family Co(II)/Ni(II) efflux transporter DmeF [Gammaproteobacteria bacterium]